MASISDALELICSVNEIMNIMQTGYLFPPFQYCITSDIVRKYEEAVETENRVINYIPPLAIAAFAMKVMSTSEDFPPGIIHAAQEFQFTQPVKIGSTLECRARVIQNIPRGSLTMFIIEINTFDKSGQMVLAGKTTAILPNPGET